jgi:hypothetical protein
MIKSGVGVSLLSFTSFYFTGLFLYRLFLLFSAAVFRESQEHAEAVVAKIQVDGSGSNTTPWTIEEHITALSARVSHMTKLAKLPDAAIQAFKCLWPGETVPNRIDAIGDRLKECGARLNEWQRSAARSGADTALRFVCSWYEGINLDALETLRSGAPTDTDPAL